jgi:hypothetical protein
MAALDDLACLLKQQHPHYRSFRVSIRCLLWIMELN